MKKFLFAVIILHLLAMEAQKRTGGEVEAVTFEATASKEMVLKIELKKELNEDEILDLVARLKEPTRTWFNLPSRQLTVLASLFLFHIMLHDTRKKTGSSF